MAAQEDRIYDFAVVGGGVAGVCCAQQLAELCPSSSIKLLAAKDVVKLVTNYSKVTRALEKMTVEEKPATWISERYPNIQVVRNAVDAIDPKAHIITTSDGQKVAYKKVCICTGGKPDLISYSDPYVIGIRDVESVEILQNRLSTARRIIVIGNGGIALELVYELVGCEVVWAIKDDAIGNVFLDKGAATFLLPHLEEEDVHSDDHPRKLDQTIVKRRKYTVDREKRNTDGNKEIQGSALGPDWSINLELVGGLKTQEKRKIHIEYSSQVKRIFSREDFQMNCVQLSTCRTPSTFMNKSDWNVYVELTNDSIYGADFVVSATGVVPNIDIEIIRDEIGLGADGGIKVDNNMRTNLIDIYAAGDVCTASWDPAPHWFQMRLWTQARQMGVYAANCMVSNSQGQDTHLDFCFELFAHMTNFFGYKICLLGKYNGQGLGTDCEYLVRYTKGDEYVKVVLKDGKMFGAVLIGETDLEETFENLIINELDLSRYGENLLDPNIDIEDFFD